MNDGTLGTAWVEFDLGQAATLSEVTLKLSSFKSNVYPLRITVDGKEAFNGFSETTLGYCTLKCSTPQKGKKMRIEMTAPPVSREKSIGLEVTGKKLGDGSEGRNKEAKGSFGIIEIELYENI